MGAGRSRGRSDGKPRDGGRGRRPGTSGAADDAGRGGKAKQTVAEAAEAAEAGEGEQLPHWEGTLSERVARAIKRAEAKAARLADVEVTDTSGEPGGAVVTRLVPRERDSRLKRYEPVLPGGYRRGGGPKSAEGRAVASRNALTHGAYSEAPQGLPAYIDHQRQVQLSLNPVGALEDSIAEEVSHATWRRDLLARHERREATMIEGLGPPLAQVAVHSGFPFGERHHHLLAAGVDLFQVKRELKQLWRGHLYVAASGGLGLGAEGMAVFGARPVPPQREEEFLRRWDEAVALAPHTGGALHKALQTEAAEAFLARLWVYRHWLRVAQARALLTSRSITEFLGSQTLGRARALIDRSVREGMESMERARRAAQPRRLGGGGGRT